ncbi:hypothetical protein FBULB1_11579 [Fusarium bulbicola]|nr:hypothetical protein FBULB1_11579 [Fusarium bulbicola]
MLFLFLLCLISPTSILSLCNFSRTHIAPAPKLALGIFERHPLRMDCSPERLESLVSDEDVEFDADIAGPGVLAAFLVTSLIALATLILAFLTIPVPAHLLNSGDDVIAAGARRIYRRLRAKFPNTKLPKVDQSRSERTHAFMAFMVAISDQILVSQASILIAALIIHDDITTRTGSLFRELLAHGEKTTTDN